MTAEELIALGSISEIKTELTRNKIALKVDITTCTNQFDPLKHDVLDPTKRQMKTVQKATGQKDDKGQPVYGSAQEEVARIAIPYQRIIVERAIGFLLGNAIKLEAEGGDGNDQQQKLMDMIERIWAKNKLDYQNKNVARFMFSECESAELWYLVEAEEGFWGDLSKGKFKPKMKVLSQSLGDILYPYFDLNGDMIAFGREYAIMVGGTIDKRFDLYTSEATYKYSITANTVEAPISNQFKKIPVIYYRQEYPEWYTVQAMIDRLETSISNRADSNDYSGAPITIVKGQIQGFASKGEQGKVFQVSEGGDVSYLESQNAPEATKLEWGELKEMILSMTQTPDISFSQMKGLGALSGIALKLMFLDAHMKARTKEGTFGEGIQRRINLLLAMIGNVIDTGLGKEAMKLDMVPVFTPYLPLNEKEEVDTISVAKTAGVMSVESGVRKNPLVTDPDAEIIRIKAESAQSISGTAN